MYKYICTVLNVLLISSILHADPAAAAGCEESVRPYWAHGSFTDAAAAGKAVEACLKTDPADAEAHYLQAVLSMEREDYDAALRSLDEAVRRNPAYAKAYMNRAELHLFLKHAEQGLADYDAAVALEPGNPALRMKRANVLLNRQKFHEAAAEYSAVIKMAPDLPEAYNSRAIAFAALGRKEEMCFDFRQMCEMGFCMNLEKAQTRNDCPR